jgi:hypothetical protein
MEKIKINTKHADSHFEGFNKTQSSYNDAKPQDSKLKVNPNAKLSLLGK